MDNINEVADRVGQNFEDVKNKLSERTSEIHSTVQAFVDESPLRAVGIAFGVGYLLSGALFSRTTMRVAGLGGRFVLGGLIKQLVTGMGPGVLAAMAMNQGEEPHKKSQARPNKGGGGNGGSRPQT
jgi:hypothetical protein